MKIKLFLSLFLAAMILCISCFADAYNVDATEEKFLATVTAAQKEVTDNADESATVAPELTGAAVEEGESEDFSVLAEEKKEGENSLASDMAATSEQFAEESENTMQPLTVYFSGGSGTSKDPYEIACADDL